MVTVMMSFILIHGNFDDVIYSDSW